MSPNNGAAPTLALTSNKTSNIPSFNGSSDRCILVQKRECETIARGMSDNQMLTERVGEGIEK
jgi:hypothetical protein